MARSWVEWQALSCLYHGLAVVAKQKGSSSSPFSGEKGGEEARNLFLCVLACTFYMDYLKAVWGWGATIYLSALHLDPNIPSALCSVSSDGDFSCGMSLHP